MAAEHDDGHEEREGGSQQRDHSDETKPAVIPDEVEDDEEKADEAGNQTGIKLILAEGRRQCRDLSDVERHRQCTVLEHIREFGGRLLVEAAFDLRLPAENRLAEVGA